MGRGTRWLTSGRPCHGRESRNTHNRVVQKGRQNTPVKTRMGYNIYSSGSVSLHFSLIRVVVLVVHVSGTPTLHGPHRFLVTLPSTPISSYSPPPVLCPPSPPVLARPEYTPLVRTPDMNLLRPLTNAPTRHYRTRENVHKNEK